MAQTRSKAVDWNKVEEMTLALMQLTTFEEHGAFRSWKGHDWDVLQRLHERGWIASPVSKAKSVPLTEEGRRRSLELFERYFLLPGSPAPLRYTATFQGQREASGRHERRHQIDLVAARVPARGRVSAPSRRRRFAGKLFPAIAILVVFIDGADEEDLDL